MPDRFPEASNKCFSNLDRLFCFAFVSNNNPIQMPSGIAVSYCNNTHYILFPKFHAMLRLSLSLVKTLATEKG